MRNTADKPKVQRQAKRSAQKFGIDPVIFDRQINAESGFDANAGSRAGARGPAQFMPGTAASMGVDLDDGRITDDLDGAAKLMSRYLKAYGGDWKKALTAYNAGPGRVGKPLFRETSNYIARILDGTSQAMTPLSAPKTHNRTAAARPKAKTAKVEGPSDQEILFALKRGGVLDFARAVREQRDAEAANRAQEAPEAQPRARSAQSGSPEASGGLTQPSSNLHELIWRGEGHQTVKHGKKVDRDFYEHHEDHVHVAAGPTQIVHLGKLAQRMGLRVSENPAFGGVDLGKHVAGSYHGRIGKTKGGQDAGEAIDVSGPTPLMREYAHRVAQAYGLG